MGEAFKRIDRHNREQNAQAMDVLADLGILFITPDNSILAEWESRAATVARNLVKKKILSSKILDTMNSLLEKYRAN